jgi:hypothetical protein
MNEAAEALRWHQFSQVLSLNHLYSDTGLIIPTSPSKLDPRAKKIQPEPVLATRKRTLARNPWQSLGTLNIKPHKQYG